ncbi:MAG: protein-glutamine glutaminase family protein [Bacteriovoracia bacterium]
MKFAVAFVFLLMTFQSYAEVFRSKIHSIDFATKENSPHLILMENGRVVFVEYHQKDLLKTFKEGLKDDEIFEIEVDEENNFKRAKAIEPSSSNHDPGERIYSKEMSYDPTVLSSSSGATSIFRRMRRDYQNQSQCYNRAHVWAWEEYKNTGLRSMKHFLFFTRRYIRNYRYKWWFHVSPSVLVEGSGVRILDRRYTSGHRSVSSWTKNFIYSGRSCPVVHKYYDYRNNQETEDCYLIPVSMYFWQPRDIERRDRTGYEKTSFINSEIDYAYWEAF